MDHRQRLQQSEGKAPGEGVLSTVGLPQIRIAPSILAADFARLAEEVEAVAAAGADWIHVDVMDGHFVPNLTVGPPVVAALRRVCGLPLDAHLMVSEPDRWIDAFAEGGADMITVHVEATCHLHRVLERILSRGKRAGVSLNPATSEEAIRYVLPIVDLVLVMTVNPGFGGQRFISSVLPKIRRIREWIDAMDRHIDLQVDGGIDAKSAALVAQAGANVLVAGTAIFGQGPPSTSKNERYAKAIQLLRKAAHGSQAEAWEVDLGEQNRD
ncbi:MAG: ribulose-phosphate 3-epimerase [Sandaracinaceae bacterium]|nr:ribulose-phosphate 3-epimerase [Sandaracinaceae bacterium]